MPLSADASDLFAGGHFVHLATVFPHGSPHTVPLVNAERSDVQILPFEAS